MARFLIPLVLFVAIVAFFVRGLGEDPSRIPSPLLSKPLPEFSLGTVRDPRTTVSSASIRGEIALLNVWGSWCVNCAVEHEFLMSLARDNVIALYGLNWKDPLDNARQWLQERGDPYSMSMYDYEGRAAIDLGVYGAPETFLIAADGTIAYKFIGPLDETVWADEFVPRIAALERQQ